MEDKEIMEITEKDGMFKIVRTKTEKEGKNTIVTTETDVSPEEIQAIRQEILDGLENIKIQKDDAKRSLEPMKLRIKPFEKTIEESKKLALSFDTVYEYIKAKGNYDMLKPKIDETEKYMKGLDENEALITDRLKSIESQIAKAKELQLKDKRAKK